MAVARWVFQTDRDVNERLKNQNIEELTPVDKVFEEIVTLHDSFEQEPVKSVDCDCFLA